jgi:hypothetical protein
MSYISTTDNGALSFQTPEWSLAEHVRSMRSGQAVVDDELMKGDVTDRTQFELLRFDVIAGKDSGRVLSTPFGCE